MSCSRKWDQKAARGGVFILNSMVKKIIFGNMLRINRTLNNHLPTHGSSEYDFNQIHEILFGLEAAHKLGVIWRAEQTRQMVSLQCVRLCTFFEINTLVCLVCTIPLQQPSLQYKYVTNINISLYNGLDKGSTLKWSTWVRVNVGSTQFAPFIPIVSNFNTHP